MSFVDVYRNRKNNALEVNQNEIFCVLKKKMFYCFLKFYEKSFEALFLQATGEYYREEGNRLIAKLDCIQYMKKVIENKIKKIYFFNLFISIQISLLIDDEEFRSRKFLNSTSYKKVHKECLQCLVCDHFDTLKSECNELIIKEDLDGI